MNHTSSLRYAVAGEIPVFSASWRIRLGRHERREKILMKRYRIFFLDTIFVLLVPFACHGESQSSRMVKKVFICRSING